VGIIFSCINCETKPDRGKDEYSNVNENLLQNALDLSLGQGDGRECLIWGELLLTLQFFQSLTSVCPTSCHILKILTTISTASVFCGHTIHTFHVVFIQYDVSEHICTMLTFS